MCGNPRSALAAAVLLLANAAAEPIVVTLRAEATVSGSQVTVGDVADLQGGDESLRQRMARLDLTELPLSSQPILVLQHQVGFRLQLAGFNDDAFRLEGPRVVRVCRPAAEALDNKIVAAARAVLEQQLAGHAEETAIQLAQAVILPPLSADGEDIHLEAEVRVLVVAPCRVPVEVSIYVRGARRSGVIVYLDVKKLQAIPVALRRIEAGETFSEDNFRVERIAVDNARRTTIAAELLGRSARRPVPSGQPIEADDIKGETPAAIVIHANDLVHLLAKAGPMQVKARGEALQAGSAGQLIQVRNIDSKTIITGRVVDRSTVEVEY